MTVRVVEGGAQRVLHVNLNVVDRAASEPVYADALKMTCRMRSDAYGQEIKNDPLGTSGPTDSIVLFYYDHRGGRRAPAVELVEWLAPPTEGAHYERPSDIGLQAIGFAVPSVEQTAELLVASGARITTDRTSGGELDSPVIALDADGVRIELFEAADVVAPTFRRIRVNVTSLDRSVRWYEGIGWSSVGRLTQRWHTPDAPDGVPLEVVRLTLPRDPEVELWLTQWPEVTGSGAAHGRSNHRGLFRMALSVDDVDESVRLVSSEIVTVPEPTPVPLPGTPMGEMRICFLHDPDDLIVEFVPRA